MRVRQGDGEIRAHKLLEPSQEEVLNALLELETA